MERRVKKLNIKGLVLLFAVIFAVLISCVFCVNDVQRQIQAEQLYAESLLTNFNADGAIPEVTKSAPQNAGVTKLASVPVITNVAVFIYFKGENEQSFRNEITSELISRFNGTDTYSLKDYYQQLSYGSLTVNTVFPISGSRYYVYMAPNSRSYYDIKDGATYTARAEREQSLLNGALASARTYLASEYATANLDADGDNYVDSVSFLLSGTYDNNWGGLLWPHAWKLDSISGGKAEKLGGIKVNSYTVTFTGQFKLGLNAHELGHVLGLPDLYHYNYDIKRLPVGKWDIMHNELDVPQFTTTHLRQRYLGWVGENQVVPIYQNGEYTLTATTAAGREDVLAYRIEVNEFESIWIEYRSRESSSYYDGALPGSGLIVYRVNTSVKGNEGGAYQKEAYPDEVFVYRPNAFGSMAEFDTMNLSAAYLSASNGRFNVLGELSLGVAKYKPGTIYLTDGSNTGIVITPLTQSDNEARFRINLGSNFVLTPSALKVADTPYTMTYGSIPKPKVMISYVGDDKFVVALPAQYKITNYDNKLLDVTQKALVTLVNSEGNLDSSITCQFDLKVVDVYDIDTVKILTPPNKLLGYSIGEKIDLTGLSFSINYLSGRVDPITYSKAKDNDWLLEGVDINLSGTYNAKITYKPLNNLVITRLPSNKIEFEVRAESKALRVSMRDSETVVRTGVTPSLKVELVLNDNTFIPLTSDRYSLSSFIANDYFTPQTVTVTFKEEPSLKTTVTVYAVTGQLSSAEIIGTYKNVYGYGESLNLLGADIKLSYQDGNSVTVPLENYYSRFDAKFNGLIAGTKNITATFDNFPATIQVKVLELSESIVTSNGDNIIISAKSSSIILKSNMTLTEFRDSLASYLNLRFFSTDVQENFVGYSEVTVGTYPNLMITSDIFLRVYNDKGEAVTEGFSVYLLGDADKNGIVDERDLAVWITKLATDAFEPYLDANGDGEYTLTDLVLLYSLLRSA